MDHGLDSRQRVAAAERLQRLAEVGDVGAQEGDRILGMVGLGRADLVDVEDLVAVREQVADDDAAGLAATSGDCDLGHARSSSTRIAR
jgi:hypothetical protein